MNSVGYNIWSLVSSSNAAEKGWCSRKTKDEKCYKWRVACDTTVHLQQWWLRREVPEGGGWLCVMCSVFNLYAREINIWEPQQWAAVWWSSGSPGRGVLATGDEKHVHHGTEEWCGMHSNLVMMVTGDSFEVSWRRWNSFTLISVCCHWDSGRIPEEKVFEVLGSPLHRS